MWTWDSGLLGCGQVFQGFLYVPALYDTSDLLHMRRGWLKLLLILANVRVFRVILCGTIMHLSNFFSPHRFVNETKGLLRGILARRGQSGPRGNRAVSLEWSFFFKDDGHLFWKCSCPPLVQIRESPESADPISTDNSLVSVFLATAGYLLCLATLLGPPGPIHLRRIFSTT